MRKFLLGIIGAALFAVALAFAPKASVTSANPSIVTTGSHVFPALASVGRCNFVEMVN